MTQLHPMAERLLAGMRPQLIALPGYPPGWFARFLDRERDALLAEWSPILFQFFPVPAAPAAAPAPAPAAPAYSLEDARVRAFQDLIVEQTADAPMTAYQFAVKRRSERQGFVEGGEDTAGTLTQMRALAAQGRGQWVGDGFRGIRPASQTTGSARFAPTAELPKPAENAEPLRFERCGSSLCVAAERRLNGRRWNDYLYLLRDVLRGSYREAFNGMTHVQVFPLDQAHRVYEELVKAGWAPRGSAVPTAPSEAVASTFTAGGEGSAAIYGVVKPRIKLAADGGSLKVSLADMLGGAAYLRYNEIVKEAQGTALEKEPTTFLVDPEEAVAMVSAMRAAGWEVEGSPIANGLLQEAVQRLQQEAKDYAERERAAARFIDERVRALQARRGIDVAAYQREGALWLASHHGAILADQMGLGKTLQVLLSAPPGRGIVVLGPVAAKRAFREDVPKFRRGLGIPGDGDLTLTFLDGMNSFRWAAPGEIVVGSWATMPAAGTAPSPPPGTILVADEAHLLKNPKATRTHQFRALAAAVLRDPAGHVYELTGSPFKNPREGAKFVAKDLWEVLQNAQLGSGIFGTQKRFEALRGSDKGNKLLAKGMLRRTRETVGLDKVGLTHQVVKIDVTAEQKREFDKFNEYLDDFLAAFIEKSKDLAAERRAVVFAEISKARKALATAKIPEMLAQVEEFEEQQEPLLVFSMHTDPINLLAKREGWAVITGETSQKKRDEIVTAFQAGQYKGLGLTIGAGGTSLNLSRAHYALFVDHDWTPSGNEQAEYRMLRYTQEHDCVARVLVMNHPLDLRVEDLLTSKQKQIKRTVDAVSAAMSLNQKPVAPEAVTLAAPRQLPDLRLVRQGEKPGEEGAEERPQAPRPARTELERWAERAVVALTEMDPDRAGVINGAGWNKMDGGFGASLAGQLQRSGGNLTDRQWEAAIRVCRKYRGQVGAPPEGEDAQDAQAATAPAPAAAVLPAPRPAAVTPDDARARGFVTDMRGEQGRSAILMAAPPAPPAAPPALAAAVVSAAPAPALRAATRMVLARWADLQRQLDKDLTTQENRLRELSGQRTTDVVERARATATRLLGEAQRLKQVVTLLSAQGNAGTLPRPLEGLGNRLRLTGLLAAQTAQEVPEEDKRAWEALRSALYWRQGDLIEGPGGQQARVAQDTPREETLITVRPLPTGTAAMNTTWRAADVRFVATGDAAAAADIAAHYAEDDAKDLAAAGDSAAASDAQNERRRINALVATLGVGAHAPDAGGHRAAEEAGLPTPPEGWPASPGLRWEKEGALWKPVVVPLTAGLTLAQAFAPGDQVVTGYGTSGTVATVGQSALQLRSESRGRSGGTIGNLEALASGAARSPREAVADPRRELAINAVDDFVVRTTKEALDTLLSLPALKQSAALKALARLTLETLTAGPRVPTLAPGELVVIPDGIRALHGLSVGARLGSGSYSFTEPDATLRRLQRDGLVVSQVEPHGGPHETAYTLTELGRAQLAAYPLIQVLDDEDLRLLRVLAAAPGPWPVEDNPTNARITRRLALSGLILRGAPSKVLYAERPATDYECTAAGRALLDANQAEPEPECHKVQVFLGQTRDPALMRRLDALGWGEVVQRNELPPRRAPWFFDNGAFRDWQAGTPFDDAAYTMALLKLERRMGTSVKPIPAPVFITLPDVPARGAESLALSLHWLNTWQEWPAPLYLVVQDGMTFADIEPHAARLGGIFIGGSVEWKQAAIGPWCAWAHEHGLKCHVGRAANLDTLALAIDAGVDSIDSSLPLWSKENLERFKRHLCPPGGMARTLPAPTAEEERDAEDVAEDGAALDAGGEAPDALDEEALKAWKRNQSVRDRLSEVERKLKLLEDRAKDAGVLDDYLNSKVPKASAKAQALRELRAGPEGLDALRARRPELRQQLIEGALPLSPEARDKLLAGMRATKTKRSLLARIVEAGDRGIARTDYDVSDGNLIAFQAAGFLAPSVARPGAFVATEAGRAALVQVTPPPKAPPPPLVVPPTPEGGPAEVALAPRTAELLRYVGLQLRSQSFMMSPERAAAVELLRDATPEQGSRPRAELLAYREQLVPFAAKGALANAALLALDHEIATGTPAELPRLRCDSPGCGQFTTIDALVRTGGGMEMILCPRHGGPPVRETPPPPAAEGSAAEGSAADDDDSAALTEPQSRVLALINKRGMIAADSSVPGVDPRVLVALLRKGKIRLWESPTSRSNYYVPADAPAPPASEAALRFRDQLGAVLPDLFARSAPLLWPILKSGELPWLIR